ncbi:ficolin-2-like [Lingula anatina]|uniref:Ficolin-2-like n=1 Tax=Lingula anatina TaxID=7574 RepID=A0A1S3J4R0_LINAN|nr:ficolin-2-like [Lingula anatina]|eukprot:XP_013405422.1 ficolin-2-like [Lingula anatina]
MRSYVEGFGQLGFEFWWGLDNMYQLTNPKKNSRKYELRVDLKDFNGHSGFGVFTDFSISSASDGYKLYLGGLKEGNIGDSFIGSRNMTFSTRDRDHNKMATKHHGGWWYSNDSRSNLNGNGMRHGPYYSIVPDGVYWKSFRGVYYSLEATKMAVRPMHMPKTTSSTKRTTKSTTTSTTKSTTTSTTKTTTKTTTTTPKSTSTTHKMPTTTRKHDDSGAHGFLPFDY